MYDTSAIEFAMTTGAVYLDFWEYQEVTITCDQEQSTLRTMRFDPIDKTAVSVNVKNTVGAVVGETLRMEFNEVYH